MKLYWIKAITMNLVMILLVQDHQKHPINLKVELFIIIIIIVELKHIMGFIKLVNWLDFYIKVITLIIIIIEPTIVGITIIINFIIMEVVFTIIIRVGWDHLQNLINLFKEGVLVLVTLSPIIEVVIRKMVVPIVKMIVPIVKRVELVEFIE